MIGDLLFGAPVGECNRCHRKTWEPDAIGNEDRMTQPDGGPCGGMFVNPNPEEPR